MLPCRMAAGLDYLMYCINAEERAFFSMADTIAIVTPHTKRSVNNTQHVRLFC